jgi:hypothetical protein
VIPASYPSSAANAVVSQIVVIFSNSFPVDLGTGYSSGDPIGCVPVSGMTFNTLGRLTCKLTLSVSAITYPTITITGYDQIANASTVRFRFAGLKTLVAGIQDYIKVGVQLVYYNYGGVSGNLYEPTSVVVGPTTAVNSAYSIIGTIV